MSDLERMLAEWLEYLDVEEGDMPLPEWAGETGWIQGDDGILEDWGIYLLRLAHDEIAALKRIKEAAQRVADDESEGLIHFAVIGELRDALLTEKALGRPGTQLAGTRKPMIGGTEITAEEQER